MKAILSAIEYYLPKKTLDNIQLEGMFPDWPAQKIADKTGILSRHIAADNECSSDLAIKAGQRLFDSGACRPEDIDYIILCTQTPDYYLPHSSAIVQDRLGIRTSAGAIDINLGCSAYIYALGVAKPLIESGQAENVLLLTAETYSKLMDPDDWSTRTIFGDAATASLIKPGPGEGKLPGDSFIGPFVYGTDGSGASNLIVKCGALRNRATMETEKALTRGQELHGAPCGEYLHMNGPEIFNFTLKTIPPAMEDLLNKSGISDHEIDHFVFHQANAFMLEHLRKKLKIPKEKFVLSFADYGNTVSSTIPIALRDMQKKGGLHTGDIICLFGFGVGYSWGATLLQYSG